MTQHQNQVNSQSSSNTSGASSTVNQPTANAGQSADLNTSVAPQKEERFDTKARMGVSKYGMEFVAAEQLGSEVTYHIGADKLMQAAIGKASIQMQNSLAESLEHFTTICDGLEPQAKMTQAAMHKLFEEFFNPADNYKMLRDLAKLLSDEQKGQDKGVEDVKSWLMHFNNGTHGVIPDYSIAEICKTKSIVEFAQGLTTVCDRLFEATLNVTPNQMNEKGAISIGSRDFALPKDVVDLLSNITTDNSNQSESKYYRGQEENVVAARSAILAKVSGCPASTDAIPTTASREVKLMGSLATIMVEQAADIKAEQEVRITQSGAMYFDPSVTKTFADSLDLNFSQKSDAEIVDIQGLLIAAGLKKPEDLGSRYDSHKEKILAKAAEYVASKDVVDISNSRLERAQGDGSAPKGMPMQDKVVRTIGLLVEKASNKTINKVEIQPGGGRFDSQTASEQIEMYARLLNDAQGRTSIDITSSRGQRDYTNPGGLSGSVLHRDFGSQALGEQTSVLTNVGAAGQQVEQMAIKVVAGLTYVDLRLKDGLELSMRLPTLDYLANGVLFEPKAKALMQQMVKEFSDQSLDLKDNKLMKILLQEGEIVRLSGGQGGSTVSGANWVGLTLASDALIENVKFENCLLDFGTSKNAKFDNCTFNKCATSLHAEHVTISGCTFTGGSVVGEISGILYNETKFKSDVSECLLGECSVNKESYAIYQSKYGDWKKGRFFYDFYASAGGLSRYVFAGSKVSLDPAHCPPGITSKHLIATVFGPADPFKEDRRKLLSSARLQQMIDGIADMGSLGSLHDHLSQAAATNNVDISSIDGSRYIPTIEVKGTATHDIAAYSLNPINTKRDDRTGEQDYHVHLWSGGFLGKEFAHRSVLHPTRDEAGLGSLDSDVIKEYDKLTSFLHRPAVNQVPLEKRKQSKPVHGYIAVNPDQVESA